MFHLRQIKKPQKPHSSLLGSNYNVLPRRLYNHFYKAVKAQPDNAPSLMSRAFLVLFTKA